MIFPVRTFFDEDSVFGVASEGFGGGAFDRGAWKADAVAEAVRQDARVGCLPSFPPLEHLPCHLVHFALGIFVCRRGLA